MNASEWAAWVQAIGSVIAIAVAIWVPWKIHNRERKAVEQASNAYKRILAEALEDLRKPIAYLTALSDFAGVRISGREVDPVETADQITNAIVSMKEANAILDHLDELNRLDRFGAIRAIFNVRRKLREHMPKFEREFGIVETHPTEKVVEIAIYELGSRAHELREAIEAAIQELNDD